MKITENRMLLQKSKEALKDKWGLAIGTFLIYVLITAVTGSLGKAGSILSLLIAGPLSLGASNFSLAILRGREAGIELIFQGFNRFTTALLAYLLLVVVVLLWTILLIVPGIIALLAYSMTFYILSDEPAISATEALNKSKELMKGYKLKLFYLHLRFFLLALLCILTLGIGFLWLVPYVHITMAAFYEDIKHARE